MLSSYRKNDPVIYVCQNNDKRVVEISAVNREAETMVGYSSEELAGKPMTAILPDRINKAIADIIEFEPGARDVAEALLKCRDFGIRNKRGQDVACKLRVVRCAPIDRNEVFQVVLLGKENVRENAEFTQMLTANFKGHEVLDERTGLPDRNSLIKDLELMLFHVREKEFHASFAIIHIDKLEQTRRDFGDEIAFGLIRHIAKICRRTLRTADTVGMLGTQTLGCILMNTNRESARMACNRLRWTMGAIPMVMPSGLQVPAPISVVYTEIASDVDVPEMLEACEAKVKELQAFPLLTNGLHYVKAGSDDDTGK